MRETSRLVEGEDFYMEGAALVFTARYHLRRGYCCESNCRHCPFRPSASANTTRTESKARETRGENGA